MKKRILACVLALVLLFTASACHMVFADEQKDMAQVVAKVNDREITKGDIIAAYHTYRNSYGLKPENEKTDAYISTYENLMGQIYDSYIEYNLMKEYGGEYADVELSDEQKESIATKVAEAIESLETSIRTEVEKEAETDETIDVEAEIAARLEEQSAYRGYSTGEYEKRLEVETIMEAVEKAIGAEYTPTEKAIEDHYKTELNTQKTNIENDLAYVSYYEGNGMLLYMPAGMRYAKNLLIRIPEDKTSEITALRKEGKEEDADAILAEELAKIDAKKDEIVAKLNAGEDYDALMKEYTDDPGMKEGASQAETGYRMHAKATGYDTIFLSALFELKEVGDISDPIASDNGYYIIKYQSETVERETPLEEVHDEVKQDLVDDKASELYEEILENWRRQATIEEHKQRLFN